MTVEAVGEAELGSQGCSACFAAVSDLCEATRRRMLEIYLGMYEGSSPTLFLHDLCNKDEALLLTAGGKIVGFTTLKFSSRDWKGRRISVVYSGDTVVERKYWGQQELAFSWIARMGQFKKQYPSPSLYWFLLVKGHRTFRYLPLFGRSFYPHWSIDRSDLKPLADELAGQMFPNDYNPATGVVEFSESRGHLKSEVAAPAPDDLRREGVQFFLSRNPGYRRGHELVCICEVEEHNMRPLTLSLFRKGAHS